MLGPRCPSRQPAQPADLVRALEQAVPGGVSGMSPRRISVRTVSAGPSPLVVRVPDDNTLDRVAAVVAQFQPPILVVGRGSNLLVADAGFPGVGILLTDAFDDIDLDPEAGQVRRGARSHCRSSRAALRRPGWPDSSSTSGSLAR